MKLLLVPPVPEALEAGLRRLADAGRITLTVGAGFAAASADAVLAPAGTVLRPNEDVVLAVWGAPDDAVAALESGADVWIDPAEPATRLLARLRAAARRGPVNDRWRDPPAALPDATAFSDLLRHEFDRAVRYRRALAVLVVAPDDAPGLAPEAAVEALATVLRGAVRDVDTVARLGPGRFALILPETDAGGAIAAGARLHEALSGPGGARCPASIGLAAFPSRGLERAEHLLGRALEALLQATRAGGGRVLPFGAPDVIWSREAPDPETF